MTIILAIETSTDIASVALLVDDVLHACRSSGVQTHSQTLLPMVQQLLNESGVTLAMCDAIAFGAGPGSFTGVRTACGVAQGLAFGADRPIVAVDTLEAMAQACHDLTQAGAVLAVLDARMGEVYWAEYAFDGGLVCVQLPQLSAPEAISPIGAVIACGNGLTAYAARLAGQPWLGRARPEIMPDAAQIALLGKHALQAGRQVPAREAQPIYLRNKVALTTAERQHNLPLVRA